MLDLCCKADLGNLRQVALDGTKVKANASKYKVMSYGGMKKTVLELEAEDRQHLAETEATKAAEDAHYGKGNRGDEPAQGWDLEKGGLEKIHAVMAEIEAEEQAEDAVKQGKSS